MMREVMGLQLAAARMLLEAQTVIGLRMLGMMGVLPAARGENGRMVREKQRAFAEAGMAAGRAALTGAAPVAIWSAALAPVGRVTGANARRLTKGGRR